MGCLVSTPKDSGGNRRRPGNIGEISVYVPGLRIPKPVDFFQLGGHLSKALVERLTALRMRIVVMAGQESPTITRTRRKTATQHGLFQANLVSSKCIVVSIFTNISVEILSTGGSTLADLHQALDDYLPVLLGLVTDGETYY